MFDSQSKCKERSNTQGISSSSIIQIMRFSLFRSRRQIPFRPFTLNSIDKWGNKCSQCRCSKIWNKYTFFLHFYECSGIAVWKHKNITGFWEEPNIDVNIVARWFGKSKIQVCSFTELNPGLNRIPSYV